VARLAPPRLHARLVCVSWPCSSPVWVLPALGVCSGHLTSLAMRLTTLFRCHGPLLTGPGEPVVVWQCGPGCRSLAPSPEPAKPSSRAQRAGILVVQALSARWVGCHSRSLLGRALCRTAAATPPSGMSGCLDPGRVCSVRGQALTQAAARQPARALALAGGVATARFWRAGWAFGRGVVLAGARAQPPLVERVWRAGLRPSGAALRGSGVCCGQQRGERQRSRGGSNRGRQYV